MLPRALVLVRTWHPGSLPSSRVLNADDEPRLTRSEGDKVIASPRLRNASVLPPHPILPTIVRTSCINGCTNRGGAGSNPRPIRSDRDRPPTCISDRNAVPMVAMGPFRSPLRPGWVTGSARLSGGCAAHARSSGARRVAELRALRRTGRLSPAHNFAKANLHADQRDVDAPSGPNVRFFLSAARA